MEGEWLLRFFLRAVASFSVTVLPIINLRHSRVQDLGGQVLVQVRFLYGDASFRLHHRLLTCWMVFGSEVGVRLSWRLLVDMREYSFILVHDDTRPPLAQGLPTSLNMEAPRIIPRWIISCSLGPWKSVSSLAEFLLKVEVDGIVLWAGALLVSWVIDGRLLPQALVPLKKRSRLPT